MSFDDPIIQLYLSVFAVIISVLVFINHLKTRKLVAESLKIARSTKHQLEIEYLKTIPSIDILEVIEVDGKERVVLLISNMRSVPFRINSLTIHKRNYKKRSIKNYIHSKFDLSFEWDYEPVVGYRWNPKGTLDDSEKYVKEAAEFLVVHDKEKILVTMPEFSQYITYRFTINTNHGTVTQTSSISKTGQTHFCNEFNQSFS